MVTASQIVGLPTRHALAYGVAAASAFTWGAFSTSPHGHVLAILHTLTALQEESSTDPVSLHSLGGKWDSRVYN